MTTATNHQNPFTTDEEFAQGQPILRRLFDVEYSCPLCGENHNAETYVAHTTTSLDGLHAHARACFRHAPIALPLLAQHMQFVHVDRGDYRQLRQEADACNPKGPLKVLSVTMTAESEFSCDECARRFSTMGGLWSHMGIDPISNARTGEPDCRKHSR